jgi:hypothetical protein
MATKGKCRLCGKPGQGLCYDCATISIEWHNERLPVLLRVIAGLELHRRVGENV